MIRIGQESGATWATRRLAKAAAGMAAILLVVWLFRGILKVDRYSYDMLLASFSLIFVGAAFSTRTNSGAARAVSSFLSNVALASILVIILIWLLEWIANAKYFPAQLANAVPEVAIVALIAILGAFAAHMFAPRRGQASVSYPLFLLHAGQGPTVGAAKVAAKKDSAAAVVKKSGKVVGCVVLGDVQASFDTPMGVLNASLAGPVSSAWVPFEGEKLSKGEALKATGKTADQLLGEARGAAPAPVVFKRNSVDLPFVHVEEDEFEAVTEVGPIRVRSDPDGEQVKIGPLTIDSDEQPKDRKRWFVKGAGDTYVRSTDGRLLAKWNGSLLSLEGNSMKLRSGSDGFSYTPAEVMTESPLHTLRVTQDKVSLDTRKFTLKIAGDTVVLRTEEKTRTTDSKDFAGDLRALLTEMAKKQVRDVMEEVPIDLNEMLAATEEVLARHG